jgi:signal transduction histidine kinase/CheY-like chemotaxis protein
MPLEHADEGRILVLAPRGRDAQVIEQVLGRDGVPTVVCPDYPALLRELNRPAGAALIAEEALHGVDMAPLVVWLSQQATWSDFPFVVLVSQQLGQAQPLARSVLKDAGNVVLLERPINAETLRSAAASALRARRRQYQARRALHERSRSEERLRIAQQAGAIGSFELVPQTGKIYPSEQFCRLWGMPIKLEYPVATFLALIHPEDQGNVVTGNTELPPNALEYTEYRILRPDTGEMRWMARRGELVADGSAGGKRYIGVSYDITLRKRTEQNLRFLAEASAEVAALVDQPRTMEKLARLATVAFADWCAIDILDQDGNLKRVALAHADPGKVQLAYDFHHRYPADPRQASGPWKVLRSAQAEMVSDVTDEWLDKKVQDPVRRRLLRRLGFKSYIGVPLVVRGKTYGVITFLSAESKRLYGAEDLALAEDLGRRIAIAIDNAHLYQDLQKADRGKDIFLATLAHELRNPLAAIANGLSLLQLTGNDRERIGRSTQLMQRQVNQLARLVDDLMDIARISTGKIELRCESTQLSQVLNNAIEANLSFLESKGHKLQVAMPDAGMDIFADPVRLAQVFSNLISNAAKYTDRGGQISIAVHAEPEEFIVRLSDTGVGISPDMLKTIFVIFAQASHPIERNQGGLGIGLALVDGLVRLHGGTVEAFSAGLGAGSEFVVRLPRSTANAAAPPKQLARLPAADLQPRQSCRVLVVDDNEDAATLLTETLQVLGNECCAVHDGLSAVAAIIDYAPDIVLLDIGLPGIDGYEVARRIRAQPRARDVVLIALTGWGQQKDKQKTSEAGFDDHWIKPVRLEQLQEVAQRYGKRGAAPMQAPTTNEPT